MNNRDKKRYSAAIILLGSSILLFAGEKGLSAADPCSEGKITSECQCGINNRSSGFCCDTDNGDNGVWFRGDYYDECPNGTFKYVDGDNGDDSRNGLTPATAWRTMQKLSDSLGGGNVGIIMSGDYNGQRPGCEGTGKTNLYPPAGTISQKTIIKGHPDKPKPIIRANSAGSHYHPICGTSNLILDNLEITDSQGGVRTMSGSNMIIQDLYVHDVYGICGENHAGMFFGYFGAKENIIIRNSHIKNTGKDSGGGANCGGIIIYEGNNFTIENNLIEDTPGGISFKGGERNSRIRRNIFRNNNEGALFRLCNYYTDVGSGSDPGFVDIYENLFINAGPIVFKNAVFRPCGNNGGGIINDDRVFNNVFYLNNWQAIYFITHGNNGQGNYNIENISLLNNIYYDADTWEGSEIAVTDADYLVNFKSDHNIYYPGTKDIATWCHNYDGYNQKCLDGDPSFTPAEFYAETGNDGHSQIADPKFKSTAYGNAEFLWLSFDSPAKDAGTLVAGYHCPTADDDPVNPMDPDAACKHWLGKAPDIGAYEFGLEYQGPKSFEDAIPPGSDNSPSTDDGTKISGGCSLYAGNNYKDLMPSILMALAIFSLCILRRDN